MGYLAPGKMFDNMLQLIRFSVYFEGILNTNNGYFHIKIMILAAHMLWCIKHIIKLNTFIVVFTQT